LTPAGRFILKWKNISTTPRWILTSSFWTGIANPADHSMFVLDFEKFGVDKIISISAIPE